MLFSEQAQRTRRERRKDMVRGERVRIKVGVRAGVRVRIWG